MAACVADYCARHIPEERHHDEGVLRDLEVLGVTRESVALRVPSPTMAALIGAQYYWILDVHPVALLGYLEVLEGEPPVAEFLEQVIQRSGLPRAAFRTYLQHADVDRKHRDDLREALDRMPLTREHTNILAIVRSKRSNLSGGFLKNLRSAIQKHCNAGIGALISTKSVQARTM